MNQEISQVSSPSISQATSQPSNQTITPLVEQSDTRTDRSFDTIADHFEKRFTAA